MGGDDTMNEFKTLSDVLQNIIDNINRNNKFIVLSHNHPDGDTIGSAAAIFTLLKLFEVNDIIWAGRDKIPNDFKWIPAVKNYRQIYSISEIDNYKEYIVICVDTAIQDRSVKDLDLIPNENVINIDHHEFNRKYGRYYIDSKAAACAEIIADMLYDTLVKLLTPATHPIIKEILTCLYVGMVTDTGNFTKDNVTDKTVSISNKILQLNLIDKSYILSKVNHSDTKIDKIIEKYIFDNYIKYHNCCAVAYIPLKLQQQIGCEVSTSKYVNKLFKLNNIKIAIICVEEETRTRNNGNNKIQIKASIRTKAPYRADIIAQYYNGGGHIYSAGIITHMSMKSMLKSLESNIKEHINDISIENSGIVMLEPSGKRCSTGYWSEYTEPMFLPEETYISSDHHFDHYNIIRYTNRPFNNVNDMNEQLIIKHNEIVPEYNSVWICLGDIILGKSSEANDRLYNIISRMNGETKILLLGNHDRLSAQRYMDAGFDRVYAKNEVCKLKYKGNIFHMNHRCPNISNNMLSTDDVSSNMMLDISNINSIDKSKYKEYTDNKLIHGHVHNLWKKYAFGPLINVSVDAWNYYPIKLKTILESF